MKHGMIGASLLAAASTAAAQTQPPAVPASADDAHRIVAALRVDRQIDFLIPKLSPGYARQMIAALGGSIRFKAQMERPGGRDRLQVALQAAFERAMRAHSIEFGDALARDYAERLTPADLHAVAEFLTRGAGARWAEVAADVQQASSRAGAKIGAVAGEEAYDAILHELDPKTGFIDD